MSAFDLSQIRNFLESAGIRFLENEPLFTYTTYRVGGPADFLVHPVDAHQLALLQNFCIQYNIPVFLLGGGSNILVSDAGIRGLTILPQFPELVTELEAHDDVALFEIPANARAPWSGKNVSSRGYTGFEFLTTIPGQIGGAIIQNAGCYGYEIRDSLVEVVVAASGSVLHLSNADCNFSYRNSRFKSEPDIWIAGATFRLHKGDAGEIESRITDFKERRMASQPRNRRSAGSVFKNPDPAVSGGRKAWQLIEAAGLRGLVAGDAEISPEHCNFIVNRGSARAQDIFTLLRIMETSVLEKTGVSLEREIIPVGIFDDALHH